MPSTIIKDIRTDIGKLVDERSDVHKHREDERVQVLNVKQLLQGGEREKKRTEMNLLIIDCNSGAITCTSLPPCHHFFEDCQDSQKVRIELFSSGDEVSISRHH